jgi:hypothetical protein
MSPVALCWKHSRRFSSSSCAWRTPHLKRSSDPRHQRIHRLPAPPPPPAPRAPQPPAARLADLRRATRARRPSRSPEAGRQVARPGVLPKVIPRLTHHLRQRSAQLFRRTGKSISRTAPSGVQELLKLFGRGIASPPIRGRHVGKSTMRQVVCQFHRYCLRTRGTRGGCTPTLPTRLNPTTRAPHR